MEAVLSQRPSLLLEGEWERVAGGVVALQARYSESEVARLATAEPLLLVADLEEVLQELGRWVGRVCKCGGVLQEGHTRGGRVERVRGGRGQQEVRGAGRRRAGAPTRCGSRPARRLLPQQQPAAALLAQPSLASSVSTLRHLSLW